MQSGRGGSPTEQPHGCHTGHYVSPLPHGPSPTSSSGEAQRAQIPTQDCWSRAAPAKANPEILSWVDDTCRGWVRPFLLASFCIRALPSAGF